jgi:hypothetical protein
MFIVAARPISASKRLKVRLGDSAPANRSMLAYVRNAFGGLPASGYATEEAREALRVSLRDGG